MARMTFRRAVLVFIIASFLVALAAWAQEAPASLQKPMSQTSSPQAPAQAPAQPASQAPTQKSTIAPLRQGAAGTDQQKPGDTPVTQTREGQVAQRPSLGDAARNLREKKRVKVKVSPEEAQQIFNAVDEITTFVSRDSGLAHRTKVKRQLVGQGEVEAMMKQQNFTEEEKAERARGLLAMKKFGLLPRDFDMEGFFVELMGESVAGFYSPKTKTVSLLNWVALDEQKMVLAHELTHALQDQNYDLIKWQKARRVTHAADGYKSVVSSDTDSGESASAALCVTEGQATVVMFDYLLAPLGAELAKSPGLMEPLREQMSYGREGPVLHRAPLVIREGLNFPYREGLMFEIELLQKGGTNLAFNSALQRPPRLTHEILHPTAYIAKEKIAPVRIPDLRPVLGDSVRVQDTGVIGELDTDIFIRQYESKWLSEEVGKNWRGASYATVALLPEGAPTATNEIAMLYVSRWQTTDAAERFAKFYAGAVAKRYKRVGTPSPWKEGSKPGEPIWSTQVMTDEGPVIVETWPGNLVYVSESFDAATSAKLRELVLAAPPKPQAVAAELHQTDLTLRLISAPELAPLREAVHAGVIRNIMQAAHQVAGEIR